MDSSQRHPPNASASITSELLATTALATSLRPSSDATATIFAPVRDLQALRLWTIVSHPRDPLGIDPAGPGNATISLGWLPEGQDP